MPFFSVDDDFKIRAIKWLIFTVLFGVAPLFAAWWVSDDPFSSSTLIGRGELYLLAAVIIGDAFARVYNATAPKQMAGSLVLGALVFLVCYSAMAFGRASLDLTKDRHITQAHQYASILDFVVAGVASLAAVRLEE